MDNSSMIDIFPKEIISEILWRLPVESLIRLKSLNKSWYFLIRCLIKDPEFVSRHLRYAKSSPTFLLVCEQNRGFFKPPTGLSEDTFDELQVLTVQLRVGDGNDTVHCATRDFDSPHCLSHLVDRDLTVYCCNGIVCLAEASASTFTLYNPALREFDTFNPSTNLDLCRNSVAGIGFGCNSNSSVYKVVRFFEDRRAEVFVPGGARDSWREINMGIEELPLGSVSHVHLKGNCLWLTLVNGPDMVLCFDVGDEVFCQIAFPEEAADHGVSSFSRCNDSVCVVFDCGDATEVWVLDVSCRGGYSWRRLLIAEWLERSIGLKTFWDLENGEILVDNEYEEIESYNICSGKARRLPFRVRSEGIYYLGHFVESLVSIKSLNKARSS